MSTGDSQKFVGAVGSAVKIMRRLAQTDAPQGVAAVARETGLNVSTTFNILKTLTHERLVVFDERTKSYKLGMGMLELAAPVLGRRPNDLIGPLMAQVAEAHRVLVALWHVTSSGRIVLSDRVVPEHVVHADIRPGSRLPMLAGAVGRCMAARSGMPREALHEAFAALQWQDPPSFASYWEDVEMARETGYAFDFGQLFKGLNMAAAAVCDAQGQPRFGLSAISIADQMSEPALRDAAVALREAARFIEVNLFGVR